LQTISDDNNNNEEGKVVGTGEKFIAYLEAKLEKIIPMFIEKGVLTEGKIGEAKTLLFDAHLMLQVMIDQYKTKGITMYTPFGS
jgi:hypothetical protein